ncbi:MAG: zinc-binding dehydrogenase [Pseudomonadota bacterium]
MKGYLIERFGGPEVMEWRDLELAAPGPRQVAVDIHASGINFAETRMRAGDYGGQELPFVAGMEGAGIVTALGADVDEFDLGQRVFGRARGCHAEAVLFDADHLFALPEALSFVDGAAIPVGWLTAWHALHTVAELRQGSRVLIEAVASSVGSAALQIAKAAGCWIAGTASRDDKLAKAAGYGLDLAINYKSESVSERILEATGDAGVDVGLMTIGQETAEQLLDAMGMDGQVVMYGSTGGRDVTFNLNIGIRNVALKSMSISTSPAFMTRTMPDFRERALPLFASGELAPVVSDVLPMSALTRAHEMVNERGHFGKIILTND